MENEAEHGDVGRLTEEQRAANFQNTALAERLFERALTLYVVDSLFSGVLQDPATGDITDYWLLPFLREHTRLPDETLNALIETGMALFVDMVDDGKTEDDWQHDCEALKQIADQWEANNG